MRYHPLLLKISIREKEPLVIFFSISHLENIVIQSVQRDFFSSSQFEYMTRVCCLILMAN